MNLLFEHLVGPVIDWFAASCEERRVEKGEILISEGETERRALHHPGRCVRSDHVGRQEDSMSSGPGDLIGETVTRRWKTHLRCLSSHRNLHWSSPSLWIGFALRHGVTAPICRRGGLS